MQATSNPATAWAEQFLAFERDGASGAPQWLADLRRGAFAAFESAGFPTARRGNEPWKYTNVRPIAESVFEVAEPDADAADVGLAPYELPCPRERRLTFVDGRYSARLSTEPASEAEIRGAALPRGGDGPVVGRIADAIEYRVPLAQERLGSLASAGDDAFTALNTAFLRDGAFVHLPAGAAVHEPIHLLFISTGRDGAATHPRVLISAEAGSSATVMQSFESLGGGAYFTNAVTEAVAGPGANLRLCALQRESAGAFHIAATRIRQARGSRVSSVVVDLGGRLTRREVSAALEEPGAEVRLCGLYYGDGSRHMENRAFVDHAAPEASSNQIYKGALAGASRGVFTGGARARPGARKTSAHQVNKSLLLSDGAEADSQPKLEIFADDVSCTHGSAVGQPDADALFYMKSRGIGGDAALRLFVRGFVSEVIAEIEDGAVRQRVEDAVDARLGGGA